MDCTLRRMVEGDYQAFCELADEVDALHRAWLPTVYQAPPGPARELAYFQGLLTDPDVYLFLAETGGEAVGFINGIVCDTPAIPILVPRRYAVVDTIVVKGDYRGRGVGVRLMEAFHAWAAEKGAEAVQLNVYAFNQEAIRFYEALGYETASLRMNKRLKK